MRIGTKSSRTQYLRVMVLAVALLMAFPAKGQETSEEGAGGEGGMMTNLDDKGER